MESLARRSANAGLYSIKSSRVIPCQMGRITFFPGASLAKRALSSCSVHFFFLRKAFENTTIP